jgi:predicted dehydrogenase
MRDLRLGVIGYGERARHMAKTMLQQDSSARLAAIADPRSAALKQQIIAEDASLADGLTFYNSADEMLDIEALDGVIIGTRCSLHASMGLKVLKRNIALFLEKPIATTMEDLLALKAAANERVVVSFPLRVSALVQLASGIIASGKIGTVEHVQAWCNVPYGAVYYQSWYRDESETHGMFLQKASHDFDYINYLLKGNRPTTICAMKSKQVFRGNHRAGLHCSECTERQTCFESPYHSSKEAPLALDMPSKEMCAFAVDTGNEDSGSALIQYESGLHVSYSQNFYSRNKSAARGARLIGYLGTIEFDWFTNKLQVMYHQEGRVETHEFEESNDHGGGDRMLAVNFLQVARRQAPSISSMQDGLINGLQCLKATESANTHRFEKIEFPNPVQNIEVRNGSGLVVPKLEV